MTDRREFIGVPPDGKCGNCGRIVAPGEYSCTECRERGQQTIKRVMKKIKGEGGPTSESEEW